MKNKALALADNGYYHSIPDNHKALLRIISFVKVGSRNSIVIFQKIHYNSDLMAINHSLPRPEVESSIPQNAHLLGIDIGRVIIASATDVRYSVFSSDNYLQATLVPNSIEAISGIVNLGQFRDIYLVSKSNPQIQDRTMEILKKYHFFEQTGIKVENTYFCTDVDEKAIIARELHLTHFIDDRQTILRTLPPQVKTRMLFLSDEDEYVPPQLFGRKSPVRPVYGWLNAFYALQESVNID